MKARLTIAIAATLTAFAVPLAHAQALPLANIVDSPAASTSIPEGTDPGVAGAIATDMNADASLKNTKITVQPDGAGFLLTGSTATEMQKQTAGEIAIARAAGAPVFNAILSDEIVKLPPKVAAHTVLQAGDVPAQ